MKEKTIYYTDELNEEFSEAVITPKKIDGNYKYIHKGIFKAFTHFFWYRIVACPLAYCYLKLTYRHKIIGKKNLKKYKKDSYFLFGNHTHAMADALIPTMISGTKDAYIIVHANNVSIPYLGRITPSLGAIPLPDDKEATRNFVSCLKYRVKQKKCITIYPEAHIWPFYTKIRPFRNTSFRYPIEYDKPVFCFTNVYLKRKISKHPRIVTYVDGPFFPNKELSKSEQREDLRNQVYNQMVLRSQLSNVEIWKYIKKEVVTND